MNKVVVPIVMFVLTYLLFAFSNAGFDISIWSEDSRGACCFFGTIVALISFVVLAANENH